MRKQAGNLTQVIRMLGNIDQRCPNNSVRTQFTIMSESLAQLTITLTEVSLHQASTQVCQFRCNTGSVLATSILFIFHQKIILPTLQESDFEEFPLDLCDLILPPAASAMLNLSWFCAESFWWIHVTIPRAASNGSVGRYGLVLHAAVQELLNDITFTDSRSKLCKNDYFWTHTTTFTWHRT